MKTLLIEEKRKMGGQCATTSELENYPGIIEDTGPGLMERFRSHAEKFGVEFERGRVAGIEVGDDGFHKEIRLADERTLRTKSIIIATGAAPRILGIPGEKEFRGQGVSYCATCDADFYEELDVVVVGSGNTAVEESVFLTKVVNKVTMIVVHDEGKLDADRVAQEQAFANDKIEFVWNSTVDAIEGDGLVNGVRLRNIKTGETQQLATDGVFMFVGTVPQTGFAKDLIELNGAGYIKTDDKQQTNIPGIFAVGDVTDKFLRQVVTAAGDGAVAAVAANGYVEQEEYWQQQVLKSQTPVLAVFWSPLEGDSVQLIQSLEEMTIAYPDHRIVTVDTYKNQMLADRYEVQEIPAVLRFEQGQEQLRLVQPGAVELNQLFQGSKS